MGHQTSSPVFQAQVRLGPGDMNIEHGSPAVFKAFRVEAKGERGSAATCGDPSALLHLIYKVFIHLARKSQLTLPRSKPTSPTTGLVLVTWLQISRGCVQLCYCFPPLPNSHLQ